MKINQINKILLLAGIFYFISISSGKAQGTGNWRNYQSYYNTTMAVETPNKVFAVASGSLYSFSPDGKEVKKYSKIDGLNDVDIAFLRYSESEDALLIVYSNANIDIYTNSGVYNLSSFKDNLNFTDKTINNIDIYGKYAYVSTNFGVLLIDLHKKETPGTYQLGKNTYSVCIHNNFIYASTAGGILYAPVSSDLSYVDNWSSYDPGISGLNVNNVNKILSFQDALVFCQYNNGIFYKKGSESGNLLYGSLRKVSMINNQLIAISDASVHFWADLNSHTTLNDLSIQDITGRKPNTFWIARGENGLAGIKKENTANTFSISQSDIIINSPKNNFTFNIEYQQNKLLVTGGERWGDRSNRVGTFMVLENNNWFNFDEKKIESAVREKYDVFQHVAFNCRDLLYATIDPMDPNHYFVTSYGEGMYEFRNNELVKLHFVDNTPLVPTREQDPYTFLRLGAAAFDSKNNLYVANMTEGKGSILKMYSNDGKWYDTGYLSGVSLNIVDKILITSKNQKWINFPRNVASISAFSGFLIVDDNGTPTEFSDDKTASYFSNIKTQKGETFTFTGIFSIKEDQKGTIWAGTDKGPILFYNPLNATKDPNNFYCTRLILPYNDGTDDGYYLLDNERINTIAIDGANRKWLGTEKSGAYLLGETGMDILEHFTAENSPLISNKVNSIAINPETGEVFFATDKGLVSYLGNASEGKSDYSEVHAYPNPVRSEFDNMVTIKNLIKDSNVKITDMRGNLVYQGLSKGGMFTWNCTDKSGNRVKTGVYLVFAATPDGGDGVVTKIMVVR